MGQKKYIIAYCLFLLLFSAPLCMHALRWLRSKDAPLREIKGAVKRRCGSRFAVLSALCLLGIYFIALLPLLRANINYLDDFGRVYSGYRGWMASDRYISSVLSALLHADTVIMDISPFTQIIAVALLVLSSICVIYILSGKREFSLWKVIAAVPLGLSPYFLGCISFKFDAPYMALSILAAVAPLLLADCGAVLYTSTAALGTLVVCTTYQASTGIFPMMTLLLCLVKWARGEDAKRVGKLLGCSVAGYLLALALFKFFAMIPKNSYISTEIPSIGKIVPYALSNVKEYYKLVFEDFDPAWLALAGLQLVFFLYSMLKDAKRKKLPVLLASVACLLLMGLLAFGIFPVLSKPFFWLRGMYGVWVLIALVGIVSTDTKGNVPGKLACLALSYMIVVFAMGYGNMLDLQYDYAEFRMASVIEDLDDLNLLSGDRTLTVKLTGSVGHAPAIQKQVERHPLLDKLVRIPFEDQGYGSYPFFHYYGLPVVEDSSEEEAEAGLPVLKENVYHTIRGRDDFILIELKRREG